MQKRRAMIGSSSNFLRMIYGTKHPRQKSHDHQRSKLKIDAFLERGKENDQDFLEEASIHVVVYLAHPSSGTDESSGSARSTPHRE
jgi:hypothetical protein